MGSRSSAGRSVSIFFVLTVLGGFALDGSMNALKRLSATQGSEHTRSSLAHQSHVSMYMQRSYSPQTCNTTQHSGPSLSLYLQPDRRTVIVAAVCLAALGLHIESTFGNRFFHAEARWLLAWEAQSYVAFEKRSVLPYRNPHPRRIASLAASAVVFLATTKLICRKADPLIRLRNEVLVSADVRRSQKLAVWTRLEDESR